MSVRPSQRCADAALPCKMCRAAHRRQRKFGLHSGMREAPVNGGQARQATPGADAMPPETRRRPRQPSIRPPSIVINYCKQIKTRAFWCKDAITSPDGLKFNYLNIQREPFATVSSTLCFAIHTDYTKYNSFGFLMNSCTIQEFL